MDNFWKKLKKPVIGMAPMDGITDPAFRHIVCKYSRPSFIVTEFTNVEGLARGACELMKAFIYDEIERPIVAQVFGIEVESFYKSAVLLCELGFDGIDINMGCPAKKVAKKGGGGGLIKTPKLAKEIIKAVKKGIKDWANGASMEEAGVHPDIIEMCEKMKNGVVFAMAKIHAKRQIIPVSVKTRIGYDKNIAEEWTKELVSGRMDERPDAIMMHGRTLKQMYGGEADWEALKKAARICKKNEIIFIGNGDVKSISDAREKIKKYGVDGVLAGRAVLGNPWFFGGKKPEDGEKGKRMRLKTALEHVKYFEKLNYAPFHNMKKHLAWYCKGFRGAGELRMKLMMAKNSNEVC